MQVSLKHSGSLFMYAGHEGGAYAKNSFGNMYDQARYRLLYVSLFISLMLDISFLPFIVNNGHAIWILSLLGNMYGQDRSCLLYVFLFI